MKPNGLNDWLPKHLAFKVKETQVGHFCYCNLSRINFIQINVQILKICVSLFQLQDIWRTGILKRRHSMRQAKQNKAMKQFPNRMIIFVQTRLQEAVVASDMCAAHVTRVVCLPCVGSKCNTQVCCLLPRIYRASDPQGT